MTNGETVVNIGDVFATIVLLGVAIIPIILIFLFYRMYKKNTKRAEERLTLEKQQTLHLQQQVDGLHERIAKLEKLLQEVE